MNDNALQILITDDDEGDRKQIKRAIRQSMPLSVCTEATSIAATIAACEQSNFEIVIMDYRLPGEDGLAGVAALRERFPLLPIIMSTGQGDEMVAIEAMKRGASDYIPKSKIDAESMRLVIENSLHWAARETELARGRTRLQYLGLNDSLTGLPNRMLFSDRLDQLILISQRNSEGFTLLMMDLNLFKEVNDTLGHDAGDAVLCEVARRLTSTVRKSDTVARLGGDEFACLLSQAKTPANAQRVAEKVVEAVRQPMLIDNQSVTVGISIGIAQFPFHGLDARTLLQRADQAMYAAKQDRQSIRTFNPGSQPPADRYGFPPDHRQRGSGAVATSRAGHDSARQLHPRSRKIFGNHRSYPCRIADGARPGTSVAGSRILCSRFGQSFCAPAR